MAKNTLPRKVIAAFDIETSNSSNDFKAYPVSYQFSELLDYKTELNTITNDNVKTLINTSLYRDYNDAFDYFDKLIIKGKESNIIPVIMIHNLGFELWAISSYLQRYECVAMCKSTVKPLTITVLDQENKPALIFWDTYSFYGKSLETLGNECNYPKLVGAWNYMLERTPNTVLTDNEIAYAIEDVIVLWAYLGYYLRLNPELPEDKLSTPLLTKTSTVRYKSLLRVGKKKIDSYTSERHWSCQLCQEKPKTDFELELMHAATRGGFTYCAANHASEVFTSSDSKHVLKYDANSMHPFHACSHKVPVRFYETTEDILQAAFEIVQSVTIEELLENYQKPFDVAFIGKFRFTNLRPKKNSIFERDGISSLAWSRFIKEIYSPELREDNEGGVTFDQMLRNKGMHDLASDKCEHSFGKLTSDPNCILILNELSAFEICQQFDFDNVEAIGSGFVTMKFDNPTDKAVLSFNNFYAAKQVVKELQTKYENGDELLDSDFPDNFPEYLKLAMINHNMNFKEDVKAYYLTVKADLNSLYGIEATNEAKNEIKIDAAGLYVDEYKGIEGLPKVPKAWYQFGMRIVGWSRIHQLIFMYLTSPVVDAFICGDTDSHKIYTSASDADIQKLLDPLHQASKLALDRITKRAKRYGGWYPMDKLGRYEFEDAPDMFCASWNKSYIEMSDNKIDITLAGVPCNNGEHSYNNLANWLLKQGWSFVKVASLLIGYNITIDSSITGLNLRKIPEWADFVEEEFTDYLGNSSFVTAPRAVHLSPMIKTIGAFENADNEINSRYAVKNNPDVNVDPTFITWVDDEPIITKSSF